MADSSVAITAGSGTPIRVLTALGAGVADQQVITLADSAGNLLGTSAAPFPTQTQDVSAAISIGANATSSGSVTGLLGAATGIIQLTGTFVATVQVQVTADGSTWVNLTGNLVVNDAAAGTYITGGNMTAVGIFRVDLAGQVGVRVITTAWTSGTVTGIVRVSAGTGMTVVSGIPTVALGTSANTIGQLAAGTNLIGSVTIGGGTSAFNLTSAASTNATSVKASAGTLQEVTIANPTATAAYFKLYNKASAPTVGTDVPLVTYRIAATGSAGDTISIGFGPQGKKFTTGIAFALTGAVTTADTTSSVALILISGSYI